MSRLGERRVTNAMIAESKEEAIRKGFITYIGKPCSHGHALGERYITTGGCVECALRHIAERRKKAPQFTEEATRLRDLRRLITVQQIRQNRHELKAALLRIGDEGFDMSAEDYQAACNNTYNAFTVAERVDALMAEAIATAPPLSKPKADDQLLTLLS